MTTRRIVALALTALVLYGLAPAVLEVFGAFDALDDFEPLWWIVVIGTQVAGLISFFAVQKVALPGVSSATSTGPAWMTCTSACK